MFGKHWGAASGERRRADGGTVYSNKHCKSDTPGRSSRPAGLVLLREKVHGES
jgi:hypothetical protein